MARPKSKDLMVEEDEVEASSRREGTSNSYSHHQNGVLEQLLPIFVAM